MKQSDARKSSTRPSSASRRQKMVLQEDCDDQLFKKHQEFCRKLNLDVRIVSESWEAFQDIQTNFTLEGDLLHWLGCAVFVVCKKATMPALNDSTVHSSCVSITSLLRYCNLSLKQFFNKIARWVDMANLPDEFRKTIKHLEGSFAVSFTVFKKFAPIFNEIFKGPIDIDVGKQPRNRKQRPPPCNSTKLFEFCWTLFVTIKGKNPSYSKDLVMSFHLLVACCDLVFKNAYLDHRKDLLNTKFSELPSNWLDNNNALLPKEAPCIINYLCEKYNGTAADAKYVKEYSWKELIEDLFSQDILHGNRENFSGLLNQSNFDTNLKNITKEYEEHLLHKGDFDEKIFIAEYRRRLLLSEQASSLNSNGSSTPYLTFPPDESMNENSSHVDSPGQNRHSTANKNISRLQTLLIGRYAGPSEVITEIFESCSKNPEEKVKQIIEEVSRKFCEEFAKYQSSVNSSTLPIQTEQLFQVAVPLFYKLIENILLKERTVHKDISLLLQKDIFYECTLACSLEIVIYSFCLQKRLLFPWVLNTLGLQPFYFVRVIELIVRSTELPREAVKHLNMVEQIIFESLIWKSDSLLWQELKNSKEEFPKFEDTALPGNLVYNEGQANSSNAIPRRDQILSPGPSAIERFQSPIVGTLVEFKKKLFSNDASGTKHFVVVDQKGNTLPVTEKILDSAICKSEIIKTEPLPGAPNGSSVKPKKVGSLYIILRKFYNLAYARMKDLCDHLGIDDMNFSQKIWTVFEHSIREHTNLMRDRHLDQLLMCAVYVVCKVNGSREKKFAEIMEHYRTQPQAGSHIYRNVLLVRASENADEQRGDLINFYNSVYVQAMKSFALRFSSSSNQNANITLSPLPLLVNNNFVSPRRHVSNNLYITPYDTPTNTLSKGKTLEYQFSRSPSRDLEKINMAINKSIVGKRLLTDVDGVVVVDAPNKRFVTKMQSMMEQRRSHATD